MDPHLRVDVVRALVEMEMSQGARRSAAVRREDDGPRFDAAFAKPCRSRRSHEEREVELRDEFEKLRTDQAELSLKVKRLAGSFRRRRALGRRARSQTRALRLRIERPY